MFFLGDKNKGIKVQGSRKSTLFSPFERKVVKEFVFLEKIGIEYFDIEVEKDVITFGSLIAYQYGEVVYLLSYSSEKGDFEFVLFEKIKIGEGKYFFNFFLKKIFPKYFFNLF